MRVQIDRPIGHSRTDGLLWHWIVATTARARPAAVGTTRAGETAREESCCSPRSSREVHSAGQDARQPRHVQSSRMLLNGGSHMSQSTL